MAINTVSALDVIIIRLINFEALLNAAMDFFNGHDNIDTAFSDWRRFLEADSPALYTTFYVSLSNLYYNTYGNTTYCYPDTKNRPTNRAAQSYFARKLIGAGVLG